MHLCNPPNQILYLHTYITIISYYMKLMSNLSVAYEYILNATGSLLSFLFSSSIFYYYFLFFQPVPLFFLSTGSIIFSSSNTNSRRITSRLDYIKNTFFCSFFSFFLLLPSPFLPPLPPPPLKKSFSSLSSNFYFD